jgi:hypothetical protein
MSSLAHRNPLCTAASAAPNDQMHGWVVSVCLPHSRSPNCVAVAPQVCLGGYTVQYAGNECFGLIGGNDHSDIE